MSARECLDPKPENVTEGLFPMCFTSQRQTAKDPRTQQRQRHEKFQIISRMLTRGTRFVWRFRRPALVVACSLSFASVETVSGAAGVSTVQKPPSVVTLCAWPMVCLDSMFFSFGSLEVSFLPCDPVQCSGSDPNVAVGLSDRCCKEIAGSAAQAASSFEESALLEEGSSDGWQSDK